MTTTSNTTVRPAHTGPMGSEPAPTSKKAKRERRKLNDVATSKACGDYFEYIRKKRGVQKHDISVFLGVSETQTSKYFRGENQMSLSLFIKLCTFFNLSHSRTIDLIMETIESEGQ